jgi:23S rRNA (adenine2503-C2)-methyltransferase
MIEETNDTDRDADELAAVATAARAHVNLIPLNPTPGWPTVGTAPERIQAFVARLRSNGVNATVRDNRGTDIDAACGQLAASATTERGAGGPVPVSLGSSNGSNSPGRSPNKPDAGGE